MNRRNESERRERNGVSTQLKGKDRRESYIESSRKQVELSKTGRSGEREEKKKKKKKGRREQEKGKKRGEN